MFTTVTIMLGRFGAEVVAAHTIAMNIAGLAFMLPLAIGIAASIRIGFSVGAKDFATARLTVKVAMVSAVSLTFFAIAAIVAGREFIPGLYTSDSQVLETAAKLMLFVAFFQLFDNCQATAIGALRGYKDARYSMTATLVGYWLVGMPVGATLGFGWLGESLGCLLYTSPSPRDS